MIRKFLGWINALLCGHSPDYCEPIGMTYISGARAVQFRCIRCGATTWEYWDEHWSEFKK